MFHNAHFFMRKIFFQFFLTFFQCCSHSLFFNVPYMLLDAPSYCPKFIFSIFLSIARPSFIFIKSIYIFHFQHDFHHKQSFNLVKTDTLFLYIFQDNFYCFCMITWMKKANHFQIAKFKPQDVAYKNVAYKKAGNVFAALQNHFKVFILNKTNYIDNFNFIAN